MKLFQNRLLTHAALVILATGTFNCSAITRVLTCSPDGLRIRVYDDLSQSGYSGGEVHTIDVTRSCGDQIETTDGSGYAMLGVPSRGGTMKVYVVYWDQRGNRRTTQQFDVYIRDRNLEERIVRINTDPYVASTGYMKVEAHTFAKP